MHHSPPRPSRLTTLARRGWPLALIVAMAIALRLVSLDLIDLRYDEASAPQFALGIVRGQWLAFAPFSGSVANHPPVYLYILAVPYLFTRDLLAVAAYRALLDVLAISLFWMLCSRYFNVRVAAVGALLFAVAPWAIQFARKLWLAPLPLFSVLLLFGLLEAVRRRNPWGWALAGWGLALCAGTHLSALYLAPVALAAVVIGWRTLRPLPVLLGLAPLALLAFVYLQADASREFANVRALLGAAQSGGATASADALQFATWISGGAHLSDLTGGAYPLWQAQSPALLEVIDTAQLLWLVVSLLVAIALLVNALRRGQRPAAGALGVLLLWWFMPVLLQVRHSRPLQLHYLAPLYPAPFLLMGLALDQALRWAPRLRSVHPTAGRAAAALLCAVLGAVIVWQVFTTVRFTVFVEQHDTSAGGYGLPVRSALAAAAQASDGLCRTPSCDGPPDVIAVTPGGDPLVNEQATILNVVLAGVPHRFANADAGLILRPDPAQYIFAPGTGRALQALLRNVEAGNIVSRSVPLRVEGGGGYTYVRVAEPLARDYTPAPAAHWTNGVSLLGYRAEVSGASLALQVLLQVAQPPPAGADYHWFNHVVVKGQKVSQLDGGGISPANWRAGDVLLHWFDIPLPSPPPARPFAVRVGAYEYPALRGVPVALPGGPSGDGVNLEVK